MVESIWQPPQYALDKQPVVQHTITLPEDSDSPSNFVRSAKICPDGSTALLQCENQRLHMLDLIQKSPSNSMEPAFRLPLPQAAPILDTAWYPHATVSSLQTFCFATSVRDCPVKLLDASTGILRASYRIVDHRERFVAPHCMTFSRSGQKLYCGFESAIEVFDVNRPEEEGTRIKTTPGKKSKDGMKGIVSAIGMSPDDAYFAAGNLTPGTQVPILLYDSSSEVPEPIMSLASGSNLGGISQISLDPWRAHILYASFRQDSRVYAWDLRAGLGSDVPYCVYGDSPHRSDQRTNQRLRFDIDASGKLLGTGARDGLISIFDLHGETTTNETQDAEVILPKLHYQAHQDAVGSVSFHVLEPLLLSVSGARHFPDNASEESGSSEEDEESMEGNGWRLQATSTLRRPRPTVRDSSIKIWTFAERTGSFDTLET